MRYYIIDSPLPNEKVEKSIIQRLNRHSEQDIKQKGLNLGYYAIKTALYSAQIIQE